MIRFYPLDVLTSSGKHPEREKDPECTPSVRHKAADLAGRVEKLLNRLGIDAKATSGFRTKAANAATGGKPQSAHLTGEAVDLADPTGQLGNAIMADTSVLEWADVYIENPQVTKGWIHITTRAPASKNRVFNP